MSVWKYVKVDGVWRYREAIENVRKYFDSTKGLGPTSVADFKDEQDPTAREILQRDVFEVVQTLLNDIDHPATTSVPKVLDPESTFRFSARFHLADGARFALLAE
jgi:hypothetical protein